MGFQLYCYWVHCWYGKSLKNLVQYAPTNLTECIINGIHYSINNESTNQVSTEQTSNEPHLEKKLGEI